MTCVYITKRTKKGIPYFYCRDFKKVITLNDCKNCSNAIPKRNKPIKKKSNKLQKLEATRYNLKSKQGYCEYCKKYSTNLDIHEIYSGSNRKRSIENGFIIALCRTCHSNYDVLNELKIKTQKEYEKNHTRAEFINLIGKNYIKEKENE